MEIGYYSINEIMLLIQPKIKLGVAYYMITNTFKYGNMESEMLFLHEDDYGYYGQGLKTWRQNEIIFEDHPFMIGKNAIPRLRRQSKYF